MNFLQKARDNHFNKCLLNNNVIYIFTKKYIQYFTKYNNLGTVFLINTVLLIIVNNIIHNTSLERFVISCFNIKYGHFNYYSAVYGS